MPVKLVSLVNRPQTFNLVCMGERVRRDTFEYDPATGHRHRMRGYIRMPGSITVAAKSRTKLLPDAVADEVEVANAQKRGHLRVIQVSSDEAERESADERRRTKRSDDRKKVTRVDDPTLEPGSLLPSMPTSSSTSRFKTSTPKAKKED